MSGNVDLNVVATYGNRVSTLPPPYSLPFLPVIIFGGIQGFAQRPSTPFFDSKGNFAGNRSVVTNLTFALFDGVGDLIPATAPDAVRDLIYGFV